MPIEIIDSDFGMGNIIKGQGILTDQELIDVSKRHLTQDKEKFKKYRYSLCDFTAVTEMDITNETVRIIARLCIEAAKVNPDPIVAFVSDSNFIYGLMRMHEVYIYDTAWETMVFKSRNEAVEWLRKMVRKKFGIDNLTFT